MSATLSLLLVVHFATSGEPTLTLLWVALAAADVYRVAASYHDSDEPLFDRLLWQAAMFVVHACFGLQFHA